MKRSTSVLTAERSRARGQITEARQNRQTKAPLVVEALKVLPVDLAGRLGDLADLLVGLVALPVGLAALPAGPKDLPVGPKDRLVDRVAHLVDPKVHPAKKKHRFENRQFSFLGRRNWRDAYRLQ
jgi:hypothetical protein